MHHAWRQAIVETVSHSKKKKGDKPSSKYEMAKEFLILRKAILQMIRNGLLVALGVLSAGFGLRGFLLPNNFFDGGATGIALIISELGYLKLPVLLILINTPFILMGFKVINKTFAIKTAMAVGLLALCVAYFPYPEVTKDTLLVAVFGGFFLGVGIGLAIRGGSVLDGTEVMAIYISKKTSMTIGDIIMLINIIIFSVAAYLFGLEKALYSILTYLAAAKSLDFVIEGIEEYTGVTIISIKADEIREMIANDLGRGVTVYRGKRGHGKSGERSGDMDILYTVITRLEISKLNNEIDKIDPNAFIVMNSIKDTKGGMIKKRPLK
ncbi:MAG: YitT family protein [Sphingobacteriales bacterium]|nr:YitT family protein [Sphingobacteriales bacterium]MBI3717314.1 YitT family protein [Sphingobacteriales bacterium]